MGSTSRGNSLVEGGLEGGVGLLGSVVVASEELGEDGDLGLAHGAADVGGRLVAQIAGGETDGIEGDLERLLYRALVGHGGAGHVQHHQSDRLAHIPTSSQVFSAMAGERVIPRPAAPVTAHTRSSICRR